MDDEDDPGVIPAVRHVELEIQPPVVAKMKREIDDTSESPFDETKKEEQLKELDDIVAMISVSNSPTSASGPSSSPGPPRFRPVVQHLPFSPVVHPIPEHVPEPVAVHVVQHIPERPVANELNHTIELPESDPEIAPEDELEIRAPAIQTEQSMDYNGEDDDDGGDDDDVRDRGDDDGDDGDDHVRSPWYRSCTPSYLPEPLQYNMHVPRLEQMRCMMDEPQMEDQQESNLDDSPATIPESDLDDQEIEQAAFVNEPIPVRSVGITHKYSDLEQQSMAKSILSIDNDDDDDDEDDVADEDDNNVVEELQRECSPVNTCLSEVSTMAGEIYTSVEENIITQDSTDNTNEDESSMVQTETTEPTIVTSDSEVAPFGRVAEGTSDLNPVDQFDFNKREEEHLEILAYPSEEGSVYSMQDEGPFISQQAVLPSLLGAPDNEDDEVVNREMDFGKKDESETIPHSEADGITSTEAIEVGDDFKYLDEKGQAKGGCQDEDNMSKKEQDVLMTDSILASAAISAALLGLGPGQPSDLAAEFQDELLVAPMGASPVDETLTRILTEGRKSQGVAASSPHKSSREAMYAEDLEFDQTYTKNSNMNISRDDTVVTDANESRDEEIGTEKEHFIDEDRSILKSGDERAKPIGRRSWSRKCYIWISIGLAILILIIVINLCIVLTTKNAASRQAQTPATAPPSSIEPQTPAAAPSASNEERATYFFEVLAENSLADPAALANQSSAEYMATNWIVFEDPAALDPADTAYETQMRISQRYALATLYYASSDMQWGNSYGWLEDNECQWFGITCAGTVVTEIAIPDNNMTGSISAEIAQLSSLVGFAINGNRFEGSIPTSIAMLSRLQTLDLSFNSLDGTFPNMDFDSMSGLQVFDIRRNQIDGYLPTSLYSLKNLSFFNVDSNLLTGTISTRIGNLSTLEHFVVNGNALVGSIPTEIGKLQMLTVFDVSGNGINGPIPTQVGNMKELIAFNAYDNALTGNVPSTLGSLSKLEILRLEDNELSGTIPTPLESLVNLQILSLGNNMFFESDFPDFVYGLIRLQELRLQNINLVGEMDAAIGGLVDLIVLRLEGNFLNSTIPTTIGNLKNLRALRLENNELSGAIPTDFGRLVQLTTLAMDRNSFENTIPSYLGNLVELQRLGLSNNFLTGSLPSELTMLQKLQFLACSDNFLGGKLPSDIGDLQALESLQLHLQRYDNARAVGFVGTIPRSIGKLKKLKELSLFQNSMTGSIPSELDSCVSLEILDLELNNFVGTVPTTFGTLAKMSTVRLGGNSGIKDPLPQTMCELDALEVYRVDCGLTCACCTEACGSRGLQTL